ncbi:MULTISPECIES: serine acetyltransferase [Lelliottia]|nr:MULTISPECIES: serine acetyltransferase [Lelliottia]
MKRLNRLNHQYAIDIAPDAVIGEGFRIRHFPGIVIRPGCIIGKKVVLRQNTTIGSKTFNGEGTVIIGDHVDIGANSFILGDINIGSNVTIGAMSFIDKDIPDNHTVYTVKSNKTYLTKNMDNQQSAISNQQSAITTII